MRMTRLSFFVLMAAILAPIDLAAQSAASVAPKAANDLGASPAAPKDTLTLTAAGHDPIHLSLSDLKALPHTDATVHNPHSNADEAYSGVRLADLLTKVGAPLGADLRGAALADYIVVTGSDGYKTVLALAEADPSFHPGEVLVTDAMNGKPLDGHNGPFKLVVTEDKRPARWVRNLVGIELKSAQ
jgi:hypothetical protein